MNPPAPRRRRRRASTDVVRRPDELLRFVLVIGIVGASLYLSTGLAFFPPDQQPLLAVVAALIGGLAAAWWLAMSERRRVAVALAVSGVWLTATAGMVLEGGVEGPSAAVHIVAVVTAGLLEGAGLALAVGAASVAAMLAVAAADALGLLPPGVTHGAGSILAVYVTVTVTVATLVALAVRQLDESQKALRARARQQEVLAGLTHRALASDALEGLQGEVARAIVEALDLERSAVWQPTLDGRRLRLHAGAGWEPGRVRGHEVELTGLAAAALQGDAPIILDSDASSAALAAELGPDALGPGLGSGIAVPVVSGGRAVAALVGESRAVRRFNREDVATLEAIANVLGEAIAKHESEVRYAELVSNAPDGILLLDEAGVVEAFNPAAERLTGRGAEAVVGRRLWDIGVLRPDDRADAMARFAEAAEGTPWRAEDLTITRPSGSERVVAVDGRALRRAAGAASIQLTLRDVTAQRQSERAREDLEQQLRRSQKLESMGQLAGGVAHDFNNLLTAVMMNADLLLGLDDLSEEVREGLDEITEAVHQASHLTGQLLAFGRRQVLEPRNVDVRDVVGETQRVLRRLVGDAVQLEVSSPSDALHVRVDPSQLEQVIVNLIVNARDAMPAGGRVRLGMTAARLPEDAPELEADVQPGEYVRMTVTDSGVGMEPDIRERIFDPFFTTKPAGMGTGLGLSTVHGIVRQSGGAIGVISEPGRGTTFRIYLPRVNPPATPRPVTSELPLLVTAPRETLTVLLAEDDPVVRDVVRRTLKRAGHTVLVAMSAEEAAARAASLPAAADLLLTDVVMPGVGGATLAAQLRRRWPGLKVLYMSGYSPDTAVQEDVAARRAGFLAKPFTPEQLVERVTAVIASPAAP